MVQKSKQRSSTYRAYLIRCWQEGEYWRFILETIGPDRPRRGFGRFEEMVAFLQAALTEGDTRSTEDEDLPGQVGKINKSGKAIPNY